MRSDIDLHPAARYIRCFLDGVELKGCVMADEENGCAEVLLDDEHGHRRPRSEGTRMVFGKVELRPIERPRHGR